MDGCIVDYVHTCDFCQKMKSTNQKSAHSFGQITHGKVFRLTGFPGPTSRGLDTLVAWVDCLMKMVIDVPFSKTLFGKKLLA